MCARITYGGRVHTWKTAMKGGLIGMVVPKKEDLTPLGHEESHKDTVIVNPGLYLGFCKAQSLYYIYWFYIFIGLYF